jgi:hypothetical protein
MLRAGTVEFVKDTKIEKAQSVSYCVNIKGFKRVRQGYANEWLTLQVRFSRDIPYSVLVDGRNLYTKVQGTLKETDYGNQTGQNVNYSVRSGGPHTVIVKIGASVNKFTFAVTWDDQSPFSVEPCETESKR